MFASTHGMTHDLAYAGQLAVGLVFFFAAATKIRRPKAIVGTVQAYELVSQRAVVIVAWALVLAESYVAFGLLTGWTQATARFLALAVLAIFFTAVLLALRHGRRVPCGCFGDGDEQISHGTLVRLGLLMITVTFAVVLPQERTVEEMLAISPMKSAGYLLEIGSVALAFILFGAWTLESRRLLSTWRRSLRRPSTGLLRGMDEAVREARYE